MNQIIEFSGKRIRMVGTPEHPAWVATDICAVLGIKQARSAVSSLHPEDVATTNVADARGQLQNTYVVNESGLYALIFQSRKPEAKTFQRWVTRDVLPSIRKHGFYSARKSPQGRFLALYDELLTRRPYPTWAGELALQIIAMTPEEDGGHDDEILDLVEEITKLTGESLTARKFQRQFDKMMRNREYENRRRLDNSPPRDDTPGGI